MDNTNRIAIIGSRKAPEYILNIIRKIAFRLTSARFQIVTGGALGCDVAAIEGARMYIAGIMPCVYFPDDPIRDEVLAFTRLFLGESHWKNCSNFGKLAHARNCQIILGERLVEPVKAIFCFTHNGTITGGTATGIKLGIHYSIPVHNLAIMNEDNSASMPLDEELLWNNIIPALIEKYQK